MNLHDALDKLDGERRKENVRSLIDAFILVGRDRQSRLVFGSVEGEPRVFRVAPKFGNRPGRGETESNVNINLVPKNRVNGHGHDF